MIFLGEVSLLLIIPIITAVLAWQIKSRHLCEKLQAIGALLNVFVCVAIVKQVFFKAPITGWNDFVYVDAFSAFNVIIIVSISFVASLYSIGYIRHESN